MSYTLFLFNLALLLTSVFCDDYSQFDSNSLVSANVERHAPQLFLPLEPPAGYKFEPKEHKRHHKHHERKHYRHRCKVIPHGAGRDDSSQIHEAVKKCGKDGIIELPAPYVYTIAKRLYTKLSNARLNVYGTLSFSDNLGYWIDHSHRIGFQNTSTAWIVEANNSIIDGGGFNHGGIDGNGQAWYTHADGHSNEYGRPISLSFYNSHHTTLKDFAFRQPQFWSLYTQDSTHLAFTGIYINGTNHDPYGNSSNFNVNVDGYDGIRTDGLLAKDWIFQGGDDCLAPKGNTSNLIFRNITCAGGGIAFGSIGQYPDAPDQLKYIKVENVTVKQAYTSKYGGSHVSAGAYFKSWVGKSEGQPPQGGGGGSGFVSDVTFDNLSVENITQAVFINKCYYKVPDQSHYCDTSKILFENLTFNNIHGTVSSKYGINLNCSAAANCENLKFQQINLVNADGAPAEVYSNNAKNVVGLPKVLA